MTIKNLASFLDNANHRPSSTETEIRQLCDEVLQYGFNSAFVNPCWVKFAKLQLQGKGKVGTVISFPLGQDTTEAKVFAAIRAIKDGADELDISTNVGWLKGGKEDDYFGELTQIVKAAKGENPKVIIKFIIEACLLSEEEIKKASYFVLQSGADFVKTTSGAGPNDAKIEYIKIINQVVGGKIRIKAAGGIHTAEQVRKYLAAGADRIGTSKAVEIVSQSS